MKQFPIREMSDGAVLSELAHLLDEAGQDERRVLLHITRRLVAIGQRDYGPLELAKDGRDYDAERAEELSDAIMYVGFEAVRAEVTRS